MRIVIVGGTGLIGRPMVAMLRESGHEVVPASPSTGVDTLTGAGVAAAFEGADVVVDIPNAPSFEDGPVMDFFETSTRTIVGAARSAGVGHHVVLSIVGADRTPDIGYMRAKLAQERIVRASGVPYTIVRATQFFEFLTAIAETTADATTVRLSPMPMQPIAAAEVSETLAEVATKPATDGIWELGGPEALPIVELGRRVLANAGDGRRIVTDAAAGYFGGAIGETSLIPGNDPALQHRLGSVTLEQWLRQQP